MTSPSSHDPASTQAEIFRFLAEPRTHRLSEPVERVDTAGAVVFLAGSDAYQVKRAVKFPFMDLSTLEKRRLACQAEIAVNRDNAPSIYREALPIVRAGAAFAIGGEGEIVEWAVHMRRFDENATLDRAAERGRLSDGVIDKLALAVRRSHARAPLRDAARAAHAIETYIEQNDAAFGERPDLFPSAKARRLTQDSRLAFAIARPLMLARGAAGMTRRCHGDLHLRNISLLDARPVLFDAIEFSEDIASIDVLYDLAFLLMDLDHRGHRDLANLVLNRYLDLTEEDDGLAAMPLFLALRAVIRAHVTATAIARANPGDPGPELAEVRHYLDDAERALAPQPARLVAIGGLSGSGKSSLAARLAPELGMPPGARVLRSDVLRKRRFGLEPETALPPEGYADEVTALVYGDLCKGAATALRAGYAAVIDAVALRPKERQAFAAVAGECGVPFVGLWLDAPAETMRERIGTRRGDASDATSEILAGQLSSDPGPLEWTRIDAGGDPDATLAAARKALGLS
jgi:aminoglycoside phosphotransferase family enzyme/predicted kinase